MARIDLPEGDGLDIIKALSLRPEFAAAVGAMNHATFNSSLDWRLHELVRMRIAIINGCTVCLSWRTPEAVEAGVAVLSSAAGAELCATLAVIVLAADRKHVAIKVEGVAWLIGTRFGRRAGR